MQGASADNSTESLGSHSDQLIVKLLLQLCLAFFPPAGREHFSEQNCQDCAPDTRTAYNLVQMCVKRVRRTVLTV